MQKQILLKTNKISIKLTKIILSIILFATSAFVMIVEEDLNAENDIATVGPGGSPSIAVDDEGTVHFCYLSEGAVGKIIYATLRDGIVEKETIDNDGNNVSPAIIVDKNGIIHIAYGAGEFGDMRLLYRSKTGENWSDLEVIEDNISYETSNICIKTDKNDSVHISYLNSRMGGMLCYLKKNGGWSKEILKSGLHYSISFDLDTNGYAHFAYYYPFFKKAALENPGLNYLTNSPDGFWQNYEAPDADWKGVQFQAPVTDISVDRLNRPHISYVGEEDYSGTEDYKYVVKTDTGWTEFFIEAGTRSGGPNAIGTDPSGNPHIVYLRTDDQKLKYATYFNGEWKKKDVDFNVDYPENQKLIDIHVDNHGNVHIVYVKNEVIYYCLNPLPLSAAKIMVDPQDLVFGTVELGEDSTQTLYIKNEGVLDLYISDIMLSGGDSAEFSLSHQCDTIKPEDLCEVRVTFTPQFMGEKQTTLEIASNDPDAPLIHVNITGRTPYPIINPDPDDLVFDPVEIGGIDSLSLKINNAGDADLVIDSIRLTHLASHEFTVHSFCSVVPPSGNCEIRIYYSPDSPGTDTASLFIFSNDPENPKVRVFIKARPPSGCMDIEIENNLLDFGILPVGKIASKKLKISNTGERELVISSREISGRNAPYFKASNTCDVITPGDSCDIEMIFHPETTGIKSALLTLTSNDPDQSEYNIILNGTGVDVQSMSFTYNSDSDIIYYCMDTISTGGFILGGMAGTNAYLSAISQDGSILWQKKFSFNYYSCIHAVQQTWDKGFIVAGTSANKYRWIARLNQYGEILWQRQTENDYWGVIRDVKVTSDYCFIAVGETWPGGPADPDMWIGKFDSTGTILWQKNVGADQTRERGYAVLENNDGNFIVAGSYTVNIHPWHALLKHPDGGYLYGGSQPTLYKFSPDGILISVKEEIFYSDFCWLAHFSSDDSIIWQYSYTPGDKFEWIFDLSTTRSGDIIALGSIYETRPGENDLRIMKLTKKGDIVWQKKSIITGDQQGYKIRENSTGSIGIAGYDYDAGNEIRNGLFILVNSEGLLEGCTSEYLENTNSVATPTTYELEDVNFLNFTPENFIEGLMVSSEGNAICQNICNGIPADMDYDGIPNNEEYGPSGQDPDYDGNDDGLPDAWQSCAASFHTFDSLGYVTLAASSEKKLSEVTAVANPSPDDQPEEFEFSAGFFDFSVTGLEIGGSASLNLYLPEGMAPVTYYKYSVTPENPDTSWYEFLYDGETGAEIGLNPVILHFRDGSRGDEDLIQNGIIKDIGGPGVWKTSGSEDKPDHSSVFKTVTVYPNPFTDLTRIGFTLTASGNVQIEIYNFLGLKVKTLKNEILAAGYYEIEFNAEMFPEGIYYLRLKSGKYQNTKKMLLLK